MLLRVGALVLTLTLVAACGGSDSSEDQPQCPIIAGMWKIKGHCDASLIDRAAAVNQTNCSLTFGAPFDGFSGTLTPDGKVTVKGPQSCAGAATTDAITMVCSPGTCNVKLTR